MIKTLIAIGIATLGGMNYLRADNIEIRLNGETVYNGGNEIRQFISQGDYKYPRIHDLQNDPDTIKEGLDRYYNHADTNIYYIKYTQGYGSTAINEAYMLFKPISLNTMALPKMVKLSAFKYDSANHQYITWTGTRNNNSNQEPIYTVNGNEYEPVNLILPSTITQQYQDGGAFIYQYGGDYPVWNTYALKLAYQIENIVLSGELNPYKDIRGNGYNSYQTALIENRQDPSEWPIQNDEYKQQDLIINDFIAGNYYYNSAEIYGFATLPNAGDTGLFGIAQYTNLYYKNRDISYSVIANTRVYNVSQGAYTNARWLNEQVLQVMLFTSNKASYINDIYQWEGICLKSHVNGIAGTTPISGNGDMSDVFTILANAFNGIGNFFSISVIPGITLGVLITIPLLVGLILWLINLFKRH